MPISISVHAFELNFNCDILSSISVEWTCSAGIPQLINLSSKPILTQIRTTWLSTTTLFWGAKKEQLDNEMLEKTDQLRQEIWNGWKKKKNQKTRSIEPIELILKVWKNDWRLLCVWSSFWMCEKNRGAKSELSSFWRCEKNRGVRCRWEVWDVD